MKVNLRKAHALVAALGTEIAGIQIIGAMTATKFDDLAAAEQNVTAQATQRLSEKVRGLTAINEIRTKLGTANENAGIDVIVNQANLARKLQELYAPLASQAARTRTLDSYAQELNTEPAAERYGILRSSQGVNIPLYTQAQIDEFAAQVREYRKQEQDAKDSLLDLNIKNDIDLSDDTVAILQQYRLL